MAFGSKRSVRLIWATACSLVWVASASAQSAFAAPVGVPEITRDAADLELELRVVDRVVSNTALVFTNAGAEPARVLCSAFDGNGRRIGRVWLKVPGRGLRFALATDLSSGRPFIGSTRCKAPSRVLGSAIVVGPSMGTDLDVQQLLGMGSIFFPLVATY